MAAIIPAATQIASVLGTVSTIAGTIDKFNRAKSYQDTRNQQELALKQLQDEQNEKLMQQAEDAELKKQSIQANAEIEEANRRTALKRAVARQRAKFGASGISANSSGSAQAVLLGLFDESEEEKQQREALDKLKEQALDLDLNQQSRINTLQRSQLQQRQNLQNSTSRLSEISDYLKIFG
jgi:hypothetical protein